ncbi:DNA/RNA non-specific endonuclease [Hymenobacter cellulosilyticus]|uniref:DNA/RNA non-specific endonuclease n=1 Tax=Hymenobacter cellulosilyticus TaxID=2932248 RepID=A0A8T9QB64_9BACT|nr:DNA/RNA non-specific endonuclease [Hymenobacter cellulosilyticus]UOQ74804.1 DNA/RNA non-specific endonuclease [Hymenobacter cellulosilyticus]
MGPGQLLAHNKGDALTELVDIGAGVFKKRLKPNTTYVRSGYEYATDAYGRIRRAKGKLRIEPKATRLRDEYMQGVVGVKDGRKADDVGGHLIGDQFGGTGNNANVVAMDKLVNNYHKGRWGQMEKAWAKAIKEGKTVEVDIEAIYKDASARPHSFEVTEWINGVEKTHTINNF